MYKVIEFDDSEGSGGGISVVRQEWLTPRKRHCMWPPYRILKKFNKCLLEGTVPDDAWEIYGIRRTFYETDNLGTAREKARKAESESEVGSDSNEISRKRRRTKRIYDSDSAENSDEEQIIKYPKPPATKTATSRTSTDEEQLMTFQHSKPNVNKTGSSINTSQYHEQAATNSPKSPDIISTRTLTPRSLFADTSPSTSRKSTPLTNVTDSFDLTLTPFIKDLTPTSHSLDVISRHLSQIEADIKDLKNTQNDIINRLHCSSTTLSDLSVPDGLTIPCDTIETLNSLETFVTIEDNEKRMITYLSFVGGHKTPIIIRRILEKIFTNSLATSCNWTGKNNKKPLKDLKIIKIIKDAVRRNKISEKATDADIQDTIANWFRFTKDRQGGREARRLKLTN